MLGVAIGPSATTGSPRPRGSREVVTTRSSGHSECSTSTSGAIRCSAGSQPSSTSSISRSRQVAREELPGSTEPVSAESTRPSAVAMCVATSSGVRTVPSATEHRRRCGTRAAACEGTDRRAGSSPFRPARRSTRRRLRPTAASSSISSAARPTNLVADGDRRRRRDAVDACAGGSSTGSWLRIDRSSSRTAGEGSRPELLAQ